MKRLTILTIVLTLFSLVLSTAKVMAVSTSEFPACSNPQGTLIANYDSGTHGIVGNSGSYTGSDKVYKLDGEKVTQCFCPADGRGIQTNWLKTGSFTQNEIKVYERDGWTYIATGKAWGLEDVPYLAKNHDYACKGISNSASGSQLGGLSNATSTGILGASSAILGLANTGNTIILFGFAITGLVAFFMSFFLKKTK